MIVPLVILAALASYVSGVGLAGSWFVPFPFEYVIAAALHASYALRSSTTSRFLTAISWGTCLYWSHAGMNIVMPRHSLISATLLEVTCLLLSNREDWIPFSERIALWRREQAKLALQLRMSEGILPWARRALRQISHGAPETAGGYDHLRLAAILADAENRLHVRLGGMVMPEHLRQSIRTSASRIIARTETSAAERAMELERLVLDAVADCHDACSHLEELAPEERRALAERCEQALMELAHH